MNRNCTNALKRAAGKVPTALAGALAVLTLTFSAAPAASASPTGVAETDSATAQQVYDALNADPTFYFRHIDVDVRNGVVTLSGFVWSTQAIYRAEKIAGGLPGVSRVVDQIELERSGIAPRA